MGGRDEPWSEARALHWEADRSLGYGLGFGDSVQVSRLAAKHGRCARPLRQEDNMIELLEALIVFNPALVLALAALVDKRGGIG